MAIIRDLNKVKNSKLHDAILIATLTNNKFDKCCIDPSNGCAIYFKGHLSHRDIQSFFFNLRDDITSSSKIKDEVIETFKDYEYNDDGTTVIYTRDGWKY